MKTGKTPYEIRLDLLTLASTTLTQKYEAEAAAKAAEDDKAIRVIKSPTTEEIVAEAEKFNKFVSQSVESGNK